MDPKKESFGDFPPHWRKEKPIENKDILKAVKIFFKPILQKHKGQAFEPTAMLL